MEKIKLSEENVQNLLKLIKKKRDLGLAFFAIGIIGFIPIGITFFGNHDTNFYSFPLVVFFIIGIAIWSNAEQAIKNITKDDYSVYKAIVLKTSSLGSVTIENNEILSKSVNKPTKSIDFLSSIKSVNVNDEIGVIQVDKREFWGFPI